MAEEKQILIVEDEVIVAVDIQRTSGADFVLVQLFAGDNKTLHDKDKSIVLYNSLLTGDNFYQSIHSIAGHIKRKQNQAALMTLDLLRRYLQHKAMNH